MIWISIFALLAMSVADDLALLQDASAASAKRPAVYRFKNLDESAGISRIPLGTDTSNWYPFAKGRKTWDSEDYNFLNMISLFGERTPSFFPEHEDGRVALPAKDKVALIVPNPENHNNKIDKSLIWVLDEIVSQWLADRVAPAGKNEPLNKGGTAILNKATIWEGVYYPCLQIEGIPKPIIPVRLNKLTKPHPTNPGQRDQVVWQLSPGASQSTKHGVFFRQPSRNTLAMSDPCAEAIPHPNSFGGDLGSEGEWAHYIDFANTLSKNGITVHLGPIIPSKETIWEWKSTNFQAGLKNEQRRRDDDAAALSAPDGSQAKTSSSLKEDIVDAWDGVVGAVTRGLKGAEKQVDKAASSKNQLEVVKRVGEQNVGAVAATKSFADEAKDVLGQLQSHVPKDWKL